MAALAALLRGVNVGGHNKIAMAELRAALGRAGFADVRTHLQSGNIVLDAGAETPEAVSAMVGDVIADRFGFRPAVIMRTADDLRDTLHRLPFGQAPNPSRVLVTFLASMPDPAGAAQLEAYEGPETVVVSGQEVFVLYDDGMARSALAKLPWDRLLGTQGTARNLNTLRALIVLCDEVEAGAAR